MKSKIGKAFAVGATAALLVVGAAAPASARTIHYNNCYERGAWSNGVYSVTKHCWVDYNWWEETFQFKRDRYEIVGIRFP